MVICSFSVGFTTLRRTSLRLTTTLRRMFSSNGHFFEASLSFDNVPNRQMPLLGQNGSLDEVPFGEVSCNEFLSRGTSRVVLHRLLSTVFFTRAKTSS